MLHDLDQVRRDFPNSLLLARELVDSGPTARVLSAENLLRARAMAEAWDEQAGACEMPLRYASSRHPDRSEAEWRDLLFSRRLNMNRSLHSASLRSG